MRTVLWREGNSRLPAEDTDKALFNMATAMTIEEGSLLDIMMARKTSIGDVVPDPL